MYYVPEGYNLMRLGQKIFFKFSTVILLSSLSVSVDSLEIKEHVTCPEGKTLLLDSQDKSDGIVDKCVNTSKIKGNKAEKVLSGLTEAICPPPSKDLLRNHKAIPKFEKKSGIGVMFDYFLMRRLKFRKIAGLGRDLCVGSLPAKDLKKFK